MIYEERAVDLATFPPVLFLPSDAFQFILINMIGFKKTLQAPCMHGTILLFNFVFCARFISVYGLRITKADHVALVKLLFEAIIMPGTDEQHSSELIMTFLTLTK